ncbi:dihydroorotate dehydrogenase [Kallipyga massiliensis]|uniref:dihydroorotate dehydrogenase n=1 Tax=Kallipyga massiliensis TaxID=1472764 RepID=UPI0026F17C7A|nr:dihydroorotate dehydrogenase [Kallipyga massiliensis]
MDKARIQSDPRLQTKLGDWVLDNPIIPASGTFGFGLEFKDLYDLNVLGSISIKGTTREARPGNPLPRIADAPSGMLNAVGLENPGVDLVLHSYLPRMKDFFSKKVIANVSGFSIDDYVTCASKIEEADNVAILEINISCPNVHGGGMAFGLDPAMAKKVTREVKAACKKPVYVKLSPNVTSIADIARACEEGGADGLSLVNTFLGMRLDLKTRRPLLANRTGGLSGPGIFPLALRMVYDVYEATDLPIIGMGGIAKAEDVLEMVMAGASAVQIGAQNLVDPYVCPRIIQDLPTVMDAYGISSLQDIIGISHKGKDQV